VSVYSALEPSWKRRGGLFEYHLPLVVVRAEMDIRLIYLTLRLNQVLSFYINWFSICVVKRGVHDNICNDQDVNWIGSRCEQLLARPTLAMIGLDPSCQQVGTRELLVLLGSQSTLLPGDSGDMLISAPFNPHISILKTTFKVVLSSEMNSNSSYEVLSFGTIVGPNEIGPCDPVTLQVALPSSRPLYFVWDCPSCSQSSRLFNKLTKETGASIVLAPEDFSEFVDFDQATIRVTASKEFPPLIELTHSIQKVPLPIPVLRAFGPPYVTTTSQITVIAEGRPSSCDKLVEMDILSNVQYHWSGYNLGTSKSTSILHAPMLPPDKQSGTLRYQVEAESSADPRAIASSKADIVIIPTMLRLFVKILGKYKLVSVLYEDGDGSTRNVSTVAGAGFKWSCQDQRLVCWSHTGTKLNLTDDHGVLLLNPLDFEQGVDEILPVVHSVVPQPHFPPLI
jgi:hypothetical protein